MSQVSGVLKRLLPFWRSVLVVVLPLALLPLVFIPGDEEEEVKSIGKCAYTGLLMAFSWMLELMPLPVTSLLPVALFPLMGVASTEFVSVQYLNKTCMLFVGGLIMAAAVEHVHLHKRIALNVMKAVGSSPRMLILSFILPTAFLSMWISNTATTAMMIPIMEAVIAELESAASTTAEHMKNIRAMLAMSVCMAANIGGTGTTIGTGPNLILLGNLENFKGQPLSFGSWMAYALPIEIVCLGLLWLWLQIYYLPLPFSKAKNSTAQNEDKISNMIRAKCDELGPLSFRETVVLIHFVVLVLLWFFRSPGFFRSYGDLLEGLDDATPAIAVVILLFLMPSKPSFFQRLRPAETPLIDWRTVEKRLPWGIILLLGGGFALATVADCSGLNSWIGEQLRQAVDGLSAFAILLVACSLASLLTQVASNVASASILIPILSELGRSTHTNPLLLMLPPTLVTSFAFMLPVSTPPNAIAFGPSGMRAVDMLKVGFVMNVICMAVTLAATYTYGLPLFDLDNYPDWAENGQGTNDTIVEKCQ